MQVIGSTTSILSFPPASLFRLLPLKSMRTMQLLVPLLLLLFSLSKPLECFQPPPGVCPPCFNPPTINQSIDFGRIIRRSPLALFKPRNPQDISHLLKSIYRSPSYDNVTVGPNGARHSTRGQAQAPAGIVVDMTSLPSLFKIDVSERHVDVDGGALWVRVLEETLRHGLTPRSWTDYLYVTVGGTLSLAGISGQTFRFGPQISNVLEMDVVTGKGEMVTCSQDRNSELFYGVLGGLGQFGIITRARIKLELAPQRVKWLQIPYEDFDVFTEDEELLITMEEPDYVEGSVIMGDANSSIFYNIELAFYYKEGDPIQEKVDRVALRLRSTPGKNGTRDVSYFDFLNRVRAEELSQRSQGLWEVPHPWLNLFVPKSQIGKIKQLLLETIAASPIHGTLLIYPFFTNKWNPNMSVVLPRNDSSVLYGVSILRSAAATCTPGSQCTNDLLGLNKKIIDVAVLGDRNHGSMGAKEYLAYWKDEKEWSLHFGDKWESFKKLKQIFDPFHILAPGQMIFHRRKGSGPWS